ncbi:MAG TPA: biotin--[acetyl-CoA-carboxylase] ligase [Solirubrobacteraceae bacterium]|nr:biotin--[acetyl-CoA-carboxylase] ligase [Solirubrobacteraceae bacterium]
MTARTIGFPRLHLREVDSTNARARQLAADGAPDGMVVTASHQGSGRGRQGRAWVAPPGRALLCSVIVREPPRLIPLAAGVAVAETIESVRPADPVAAAWRRAEGGGGAPVQIKWPNDVRLRGRKVAGILVEGRPQERWAVVGVGVNVALQPQDFPPELRCTAATLELEPASIPLVLARLTAALGRWLEASEQAVLDAFRIRDALLGRELRWEQGAAASLVRDGVGAGIDRDGRLQVRTGDGETLALDSGEVHLVG